MLIPDYIAISSRRIGPVGWGGAVSFPQSSSRLCDGVKQL